MKDFETMDDLEKKDTVFYCEKRYLAYIQFICCDSYGE